MGGYIPASQPLPRTRVDCFRVVKAVQTCLHQSENPFPHLPLAAQMWSSGGGPVKNRVARMSALLCDYPHVEAQDREKKDRYDRSRTTYDKASNGVSSRLLFRCRGLIIVNSQADRNAIAAVFVELNCLLRPSLFGTLVHLTMHIPRLDSEDLPKRFASAPSPSLTVVKLCLPSIRQARHPPQSSHSVGQGLVNEASK